MRARSWWAGIVACLLVVCLVALWPWQAVPVTRMAFRGGLCVCPLCLVTQGIVELSWGEYC